MIERARECAHGEPALRTASVTRHAGHPRLARDVCLHGGFPRAPECAAGALSLSDGQHQTVPSATASVWSPGIAGRPGKPQPFFQSDGDPGLREGLVKGPKQARLDCGPRPPGGAPTHKPTQATSRHRDQLHEEARPALSEYRKAVNRKRARDVRVPARDLMTDWEPPTGQLAVL